MSRRFAEVASRALARRRPRRGFLTKTAVVGSALAVAPKDFLLKPASAYARVCNCNGSRCNCSKLCCDGYTEFCCTIYGTNGCPPGSLYGGWWRVSASNYCGGSNRYYMDCHNPCADGCGCGANGVCSGRCNGTKCGCALGSCNNRKAGCTHFRYGQCNQHIKCVGPIVCRVVTCTPPWRLEPNCTRSSRTDEYTRTHNRACLNDVASPPVGELEAIGSGPELIRVWGWALDPDTKRPIDVNIFVSGNLAATVRANDARPDIGEAYGSFGEDHGFDHTFASFPGRKEVCVYAVDSGRGSDTLIGCRKITVAPRAAIGILEDVAVVEGGISITGWAMVPGDKEPVSVDVYVGDDHVKQVKANKKRRDLADTFGDGGTRHGFTTVVETPASSGEDRSTVCVELTDPSSGDVIRLGCLPAQVASAAPFGAVDKIKGRAGKVRVEGWVTDPDGGQTNALITIDGVEAARLPALDPRPDLAKKHPDAALGAGFAAAVPAEAGKRSVCIYAVGSDGTIGPLLGCADVTVRPPVDDDGSDG